MKSWISPIWSGSNSRNVWVRMSCSQHTVWESGTPRAPSTPMNHRAPLCFTGSDCQRFTALRFKDASFFSVCFSVQRATLIRKLHQDSGEQVSTPGVFRKIHFLYGLCQKTTKRNPHSTDPIPCYLLQKLKW